MRPVGTLNKRMKRMWQIEINQLAGKKIRPAPIGTELHKVRCMVFEDETSDFAKFSVIVKNGEVITAKTMRGLKGIATRAGLIWTENYYVP